MILTNSKGSASTRKVGGIPEAVKHLRVRSCLFSISRLGTLFCKHEYELIRNPRSPELIGVWIDGWGQVYNKKICKKCNKIKKVAEVLEESKSES